MKAWELLDKPEKWIRYVAAIDKNGNCVSPSADSSCRWCVLGAIEKCCNDVSEYTAQKNKLKNRVGDVITWNDTKANYEEVVSILKELDI